MDGSSEVKKGIHGCIDLGSSFFRLLVVDGGCAGTAPPVCERRRYVGWGDDLERFGEVSPASVETAASELDGLVSLARDCGCDEPVIFGTNTIRSARNGPAIVRRLSGRVSRPVLVLSPRGEAALGFRGASSFVTVDQAAAVLDLGGTSTEFAWGTGGDMEGFVSIPWGTHRVSRLAGECSPVSGGLRRSMLFLHRSFARDEYTGPLIESLRSHVSGGRVFLATGGTALTLLIVKRFMNGLPPVYAGPGPLDPDDLYLIRRRLGRPLLSGRLRALPVEAERVPLILPGLLLLERIVSLAGVAGLTVTARDLRWGVVMCGGIGEEHLFVRKKSN